MTKDKAIEQASAFITKDGYLHGACLAAIVSNRYEEETWEVEFAHEGMSERCQTTDPPSILIAVNSKTKDTKLVSLM